MWWLFHPSLSSCPFPLHLSVSLKCGLSVGRNYSMKEMEWGRTIDTHGARGGSNGVEYNTHWAGHAGCIIWSDIHMYCRYKTQHWMNQCGAGSCLLNYACELCTPWRCLRSHTVCLRYPSIQLIHTAKYELYSTLYITFVYPADIRKNPSYSPWQ